MFNLVNGFGGQTQQVRQNPDDYAKQYAEQNGLSFEEAKAELKAKYGDPQQQNSSSNIFSCGNFGSTCTVDFTSLQEEIASLKDEIASLEEILFGKPESTETTNSSNTSTTTAETTTENDETDSENTSTNTEEKTTNRIKEYSDKTLYKFLKNEFKLSDEKIAALTKEEELEYINRLNEKIAQHQQ
ncbi:MAG: hypothetical protein IJY61_04930 [Candidatus Gastranaerophilales bacterium]|nr:hypothetical protein [Candidatus Gastranaerophilales bacterium]